MSSVDSENRPIVQRRLGNEIRQLTQMINVISGSGPGRPVTV
jgi:hypothetical protein